MAEPDPDRRYRLSDTERDEALGNLRVAFEEGRLDTQEHERRMDAALRAVNNTDLLPLFEDLPRRLAPSAVTGPEPVGPAPAVPETRAGEGSGAAEARAGSDEVDWREEYRRDVTRGERGNGANIAGLAGWGGFLLLIWGTPAFMSGSVSAITIFLGFFCLLVLGPLTGQLIAQRNRRLRGNPPEQLGGG
ncbi:DUF1707 SHOCT-like domain-containing protein [Nocardiopsis metallicus]|uniref:DUF1707 domain-containing protein n=1 Tax=Nocardiopsis metallicus TaxID=179819 RepID=A0A840WDR8_9ACTN|nr:DUF1707 domain-containing protein [Nocardiopsis metallicus]MBB5495139.1 hypothetical protein [Nocardiopsis metallicus]